MQARGRYVFSRAEALSALGASEVALKLAARRLVAKRRLAVPRRGFFVIVPLEYSVAGAPPPSWFVDDLMKFEKARYYVGLLSAAGLYGAAHQQPQEFQIVTDKQLRPTTAGRGRLRFFLKREAAQTPTQEHRTETGALRVSTPEATALDLVRYSGNLGGLSSVAGVLGELAERLDPHALAHTASVGVELAIVQRTGYLLDQLGAKDKTGPLAEWLASRRPRRVLLRAGSGPRRGKADSRWAILKNEDIEAEP
ncbi:MAG: type IV toxin-antitoxin system AbiEi family antitoxin domain-containing protein [Polyangiaceae bacterium]